MRDAKTPVVVFSHSPLYKYYKDWNFWTDDADEIQQILGKFESVTVIHGHTHQPDRVDGLRSVHCGLDAWGRRPVSESEIAALIRETEAAREAEAARLAREDPLRYGTYSYRSTAITKGGSS